MEDERNPAACEYADGAKFRHPREVESNDPEVLRAALIRAIVRARPCRDAARTCRPRGRAARARSAGARADIEGFFGALQQDDGRRGESHTCACG